MWKWDTFIDFAKSGIQGESWYQGKNKGSKFKTHNPNIELMSEIELKFKKKKKKIGFKAEWRGRKLNGRDFLFLKKSKIHETNKKA